MKLSQAGAHLIEEFEGFSAKPYRDPVGVWTIGYGSTKGVGPGSPHVTRAQAEARLMREVDAEYGAAVNALGVRLTQGQFDALTSFVYNVGPGGIAASTGIGRALRGGEMRRAADELLKWDKGGGRRLAGLTRRRQAERKLFLTAVQTDPLDGYREDEKRWIREWDKIGRMNAAQRSQAVTARRETLREVMTQRRKAIWRVAQKPGGWDKANRRARYRSLSARTRP